MIKSSFATQFILFALFTELALTAPFARGMNRVAFENEPAKDQSQTDAKVKVKDASAKPSDTDLYLKVRLPNAIKLSKLKPGDVVQGSLSRDVYSGDRKVFGSESAVRMTVDHLEKRRRVPNDHWPWMIKVFSPRHESYPIFKSATVVQSTGELSFPVSMIVVTNLREVRAMGKKDKSVKSSFPGDGDANAQKSLAKTPPVMTMILEASTSNLPAFTDENEKQNETENQATGSTPEVIPAATKCKILLLNSISASKSNPGDKVRARLLDPVLLNSHVVLPAGSFIDGNVIRKTPPRMLSRAGSLYVTFTDLTLPAGSHFPVSASVAAAELDQRSHTKIDAEGRLHGDHPGKAWWALNFGVTGGIAKETDDALQLIIESIVSTATDASTAGAGRIASTIASGIYLATRHGRDVVLPRFTEMNLSFDRAVDLNAPSSATTASPAAGGK